MVSKKIEVEVDGKKCVVEIKKLKWKEQKEVMRKAMDTRVIGSGEVSGKIDLITLTDETMKKAVVSVVCDGAEVKNIVSWIDDLDEDVVGKIMDVVSEMNSFLRGG